MKNSVRSKLLGFVVASDLYGAVSNLSVQIESNPPSIPNFNHLQNIKLFMDNNYLKFDTAGRVSFLIIISSELLRIDDDGCGGLCSGKGECVSDKCVCQSGFYLEDCSLDEL